MKPIPPSLRSCRPPCKAGVLRQARNSPQGLFLVRAQPTFEKGGQPGELRLGAARRLLARLWAFLPFHASRVPRSAVEY